MKYIINRHYQLRGWYQSPTGLFDKRTKAAEFFPKEQYLLLLRCNGVDEIDENSLTEENKSFLSWLKKREIIQEAGFLDFLLPEQEYKTYPARYRKHVHWSITGACNLKCRHCFMSAPHAKHGVPTKEQLLRVIDQLAECGIFTVGITGGEPLMREDFFEIVDALAEKEIAITVIFTNGWVVNEALLDKLEERHMHPNFQLSFDGIGQHDFLRGVPGAEEKTINVLKLLQKRHYNVSVSMCMHRGNRGTLRDTVKLMASLGVRSMKCGRMMELGEWTEKEVRDLQLNREEELEMFEEYIPQYFEDDAPLSIMMADTLMYTPGDSKWRIYDVKRVPEEKAKYVPSCGVLLNNFYIGADGMVAPCMGMCDTGFAKKFPNLFETPLRDILHDSELTTLCEATVEEVRNHNPECQSCKYVDRCTGGCRNSALMQGDDYYGIDKKLCYFFENGWEERITKAAEEPFREYLKRNPSKNTERKEVSEQEEDPYL